MTRWAKDVSPTNALPEYPRPTQVRKKWQNLNGLWDYAVTDMDAQAPPSTYDGKILVPYPYESALSGVGKPSIPNKLLWYHRTFTVPADWNGQHVLLNFGAVDYDATVYVNGTEAGTHRGCYNGFTFDITSSTGIWQTVWLEPVPAAYITQLKITPDVDDSSVLVSAETAGLAGKGVPLTVTVLDAGKVVGTATRSCTAEVEVPIAHPHLWSPSDPHLYDMQITLGTITPDQGTSCFGLRKVSLGKNSKGQTQILINGKFVFEVGALDQGFWPDGIYTAPTDDAIRNDIQTAKDLNFVLLRKHAKVEPERWYYWADKIGILVWQDMPQAFVDNWTDEGKAQFELEWRRELAERYNHPSIIVWTPFNEGWAQHDTQHIVEIARAYDSSRLIDEGSGWVDAGFGDIDDIHPYPMPLSVKNDPDSSRHFGFQALAIGETGGLQMRWPSNTWISGPGINGFSDPNVLMDHYMRVMSRAYQLNSSEGLSAAVYTQLTDVETELNGILTYDRQVYKMDPNKVTAANSGHFPTWKPDLVPTSEFEGQIWKYTTAKPPDNWTQPDFDDSAWSTGPGSFGLVSERTHWAAWPTEPDIWIRRKVTLPTSIPLKLNLVMEYDDDGEAYVNGVYAGGGKGATFNYVRIPMSEAARATLHPGENEIAAHAHDTGGAHGLDVGLAEAAGTGSL
jgi:hypothetical protein